MPTFRQIATPLLVAGLLAGALTGVLWAQTASNPTPASAAATPVINVVLPVEESNVDSAASKFGAGLAAYRAGDMAQAILHWEDAARSGHLGAQWNLTRIFSGKSNELSDPRRRLHYLHLVAAQHNPDAPPGSHSAVTTEALVELGFAYWTGEPDAGLPAQPQRARTMFEHAATLYGHPRAQHYLGLMYLRGDGVKPDQARALRWLFLAARKRYAPSQAALGDYFWQRGSASLSGSEDRMRGLMWFALAGENAKNDAARAAFLERYEEAITGLDPDQRKQVEALVAGWNASHKSAALNLTQ